ncbi:hypothetical protein F5Y03DRAFT_399005 [Xylaria venustula]|nr:hypothetical protein F5Y03DRAFT_399005 [Xylaria venustula]
MAFKKALLCLSEGAAKSISGSSKQHKLQALRFPTDEVDTCLDALFVTDPADDVEMIEHTKGRLLQGSGAWLHSDPTFREWLDSSRSRVLWLHGDPGKGKTMLTISVSKDITDSIKASGSGLSSLIAYFFCDNKDNRRNTSIAVLRGLVYQLLHSLPDLSLQFRTLFSREGSQLFRSQQGLHSLSRILRDFFASPSIRRVYIIIDGLDELYEESIEDILKLLSPFLDSEQLGFNYQPRSEVK